MRRSISAAILAAPALLLLFQDPQPGSSIKLDDRVASLEKRVAVIEARLPLTSAAAEFPEREAAQPTDRPEFVAPVTVTNKHSDILDGETYVFWDAAYDFKELDKPARAIKGDLVFADLFGEVKAIVQTTLDDEQVAARGKLITKEVGIRFNKYIDTHRWILTADLQNVVTTYKVKQILYADGTNKVFK